MIAIILLFSYFIFVSANDRIPNTLLNELHGYSSRDQLESRLNVEHHVVPQIRTRLTNLQVVADDQTDEIQAISDNSNGDVFQEVGVKPVRQDGVTMHTIDHSGTVIFSEKTYANISAIPITDTSYQPSDSCKLITKCVSVPLQADPSAYHFPQCVNLSRCMGGCCKTMNKCHPLTTAPKMIKMRSYRYQSDRTFKPLPHFYVIMENHESCGCEAVQNLLLQAVNFGIAKHKPILVGDI